MQQHHHRIVRTADLDSTPRTQRPRLSRRIDQFAKPLQRDQRDDDQCRRHSPSRTRKVAENPGPSALTSVRCAFFRQSMLAKTKMAVAADMLP